MRSIFHYLVLQSFVSSFAPSFDSQPLSLSYVVLSVSLVYGWYFSVSRTILLIFSDALKELEISHRIDCVGQLHGRMRWIDMPMFAHLEGGFFRSGLGFMEGTWLPGSVKPRIDGELAVVRVENIVRFPSILSYPSPLPPDSSDSSPDLRVWLGSEDIRARPSA